MAHKAQKIFCREIRRKYRPLFVNANVIDCGSLDVNGNNRWLFRRNLFNWWGINKYIGVDITFGKNVDSMGPVHEVLPQLEPFFRYKWRYLEKWKSFWPIDIVISTEMLEHDQHWERSLKAMYEILKPGGLLFTDYLIRQNYFDFQFAGIKKK